MQSGIAKPERYSCFSPVLRISDFSSQFIFQTDTSDYGVGQYLAKETIMEMITLLFIAVKNCYQEEHLTP